MLFTRSLLTRSLPSLVVIIFLITTAQFASAKTILAIGDSLTSAYGIDYNQSWTKLLEKRLLSENYDYKVVNAGTPGDTTHNGLARFERKLTKYVPDIVILGFGSNDGLQGGNLLQIENNLQAMILLANKYHAKVLLLGFKVPQNYGPIYGENFSAIFSRLATKFNLAFVPFMLEGITFEPEVMLNDNLHPNAKAQPIILDNIWPELKKLL